MRRFSFMAALFFGMALAVVPSVYGGTISATWTGDKETDFSVFPAESEPGWPKYSMNNNQPLPNGLGRLGGAPIVYGNQIICDDVYHGVSTGGCEQVGGETVCDGVDVLSHTIQDGVLTVIDPIFEDADCSATDIRRGPEDELPNPRATCNNFTVPDQCVLKDVIGFKSLGQYQGVADRSGGDVGIDQKIYLPEPPGHQSFLTGDFTLTFDLAMSDMHTKGGNYHMGPVVQFLATDQGIRLQWINWGGSADKFIYRETMSGGISYNDGSLGWDSLLEGPNAGNLSIRLAMVDGFVTGSFKAPGGAWTELMAYDMADVPHITLDSGHRLGIQMTAEPHKTLWVDEIRAEFTADPTPVIELVPETGTTFYGIWAQTYQTYWIERGGSYEDSGATAREFVGDTLIPTDATDKIVVTSWRVPSPGMEKVVLPGEAAVDVNAPGEYIIARNMTDSQGRAADEVLRRIIVYEEGYEWAEFNGHWYKLDPPTSYLDHRARARELGGYVVTVDDREENFWLVDTFTDPASRMMTQQNHWKVEIGLTDLIVNTVYQWDSGDPVDYVNWIYAEPNNNGPDQGWGPEHYAVMDMGPLGGYAGWNRAGFWHDMDDDACCPLPNWGFMSEENRYMPAFLETETDPLPPQISLVGAKAKSLGLGTAYIEEGATALDNVDGDLTNDIVITSALDVNAPGEYEISYDVMDAAGNASTPVKRTVFVTFGLDERPPDITLLGCVGAAGDPCTTQLSVGGTYTEAGTEVFDDYDLDAVDVDVAYYSLSALRLDANKARSVRFAPCELGSGCLSSLDLTGAVAGEGAAVVTGMTASWHILEQSAESPNSKLVWSMVRTVDLTAGDIVASIDASVDGLYVARYSAADAAGNVAPESDRLVHVKDARPVITVTGDIETGLRVGGTYEELGASGSDAEDDNLVISQSIVIGGDVVDTSTLGDYTVTYNVTDSAGNAAAEVTRKVTVFPPFEKQTEDKDPGEVSDFTSSCFIGTILGE